MQACMADAVAILEGQQIYLAEAALIHDPKLDKEPQDKFKVVHLRFLCKSVISLVIKVKTHYSVRHVFQIAFPKLQVRIFVNIVLTSALGANVACR